MSAEHFSMTDLLKGYLLVLIYFSLIVKHETDCFDTVLCLLNVLYKKKVIIKV